MLAHVPGVRFTILFGLVLAVSLAATPALAEGWTVEHRITFTSDDFAIAIRDGALHVQSPSGARLGAEGLADLPLETRSYVIPQGMRVVDARLEDAVWQRLTTGRLATAGPVYSSDGVAVPSADDRFGFAGTRVPGRACVAGSSGGLRGWSVGSIELLPVREAQDGGIEFLARGRVVLELEVDPESRVRREVEWPGVRESTRELLARQVANPEDVDRHAPPVGREPDATLRRPGEAVARTERVEARPVEFIILTSATLAPHYLPLAERRNAEGIHTEIVTLDEVFLTATPGADQQETIRNFLRDAYARWGLRYLLLGGDAELIPPRFARSTYYPTTPPGSYTDIPTDLYYGALDGTWNANGNGIPGEPNDDADMWAELAVGRTPLDTPAEVDAWVAKLLAYEEPVDTSFLGRALFLSEVLFPDDWTPGSTEPISLDGATYSEDLIFDQIIGGGNLMQSWRMYQNNTAYAGAIPETKAAALDSMDTGRFALVNHIGHGFYYNMSVGDANIFADDANGLTNSNPFFIHALNCSSGAFDVDSLLERYLQNTHGGAVGSAGSSRAAFPYWAAFYQEGFFAEIFQQRNFRVGDAQFEARLPYTPTTIYEGGHRWTHFSYHLFGDPTMRMWVAQPPLPNVSHVPSVALGASDVNVTVSASGGAVGAVVAISDGSGRIASATIQAGNTATVDLAGLNSKVGTLAVVVSGANLQRYSGTIDVVAGGVGHLRAVAEAVDDGPGAPSSGDGDGSVDSGETIEWSFRFSNDGGGGTVAASTATLVPVDAVGATVLVDTAPVPAVANGASAVAPAFVVQLDPTIPDGSLLHFEVQATDGVNTWIEPVELVVRSPILRVARISVDDSASGNGDGIADAGETFDLVVEVINRGEADLSGLTVSLTSADPQVLISDGSAAWPDLPPDLLATSLDPLTMTELDVSVERQSQLLFTGPQGHQWTHDFELRPPAAPGLPEADTSLGPDLIALRMPLASEPHFAGYRAYRRLPGETEFQPITDEASILTGLIVDAGLPQLTRFEYQVTLVDSSAVESAPTPVVSASTAPGELAPGFPISISRELGGPLAVGDMRGDGTNVVGFGADWIYALDASGEELVDGDNNAQTLGPLGGDPNNLRFSPSGVTMADLDGDGADEIIASNWNSRTVYVLRGDGSNFPGWPRQMNASSWATPSVGDLDGDLDLEIVVNNTGGRTYVWHHDGSDFLDGDSNPSTVGVFHVRTGENFNRSTPAIFDVDGDQKAEIIFGTHYRDGATDNKVHALRFDGTDAAGWPKSMGTTGYTVGHVTIGDLNNDGTKELILQTENDLLNIWEPDGSLFGSAPFSVYSQAAAKDSRVPAAALADFDYDGDLEMVVVSIIDRDLSEIMIMEQDGTIWPNWPRSMPGLSESSPVLGDLDGDNRIDILFGIGGGKDGAPDILYAMAPDASDVAGFPISLSGAVKPVPVICDFDLDGDVDVVYAGYDRMLHVWDMPFPFNAALTPWPTFQGDQHRTGVYRANVATAVAHADIELSAAPGGVRIFAAFQGALPRDFRFALERREGRGGDWLEVAGELTVEGSQLVFVDASARAGGTYAYRLVAADGSMEFQSDTIVVPALRAALHAAQPNPFNPSTTLRFDVPATAGAQVPTRLEVFDLKGRLVRQLHVGPLAPGPHAMEWDGRDDAGRGVGSGVYLAVLRCAGERRSLKMSLVK